MLFGFIHNFIFDKKMSFVEICFWQVMQFIFCVKGSAADFYKCQFSLNFIVLENLPVMIFNRESPQEEEWFRKK